MQDDIAKLGRQLRIKREEQGLSLKEVESATSIRIVYLEAIEEGREDMNLSPVYFHGFIRQYANFLGCEMDEIEQKYPSLFQSSSHRLDLDYGIGTLEKRGHPHIHFFNPARLIPNLIWGGALALMLFLAWQLAKQLQLV